jgi:hypothetical protein
MKKDWYLIHKTMRKMITLCVGLMIVMGASSSKESMVNRSEIAENLNPELIWGLSADTLKTYERLEVSIEPFFEADNPYDPDQVNIVGIFTSPGGRRLDLPAFYYQDYKWEGNQLVEEGAPKWLIRFTPDEAGSWKVSIKGSYPGGNIENNSRSFIAQTSNARGFLKVSESNPHALEFKNGEPLFALGINAFADGYNVTRPLKADGFKLVNQYLEKLAAAGGTFARFRFDSWFIPIESTASEVSGYEGIGSYHPMASWMIDQIIEKAENLNLTVQFNMENGNATCNPENRPELQFRLVHNFYLKENGGPLNDVTEFWTDKDIKMYFKRKLRYITSRWGYSTAVGIWEFFNEAKLFYWIDGNKIDVSENLVRWHQEMGVYLKSIDPYKRPVSTSLTSGFLHADNFWSLWNTPGLDVVQYHEWSHENIAEAFKKQNLNAFQKLNTPLIIGEFGTSKFFRKDIMDKEGIPNKEIHEAVDPMGINLHNGLWAGVFSGSIGALPWFIYDYVDKLDLYDVFTPLSKYIADWKINLPWTPVNVSTLADGEEDVTYRTFALKYEDESRIWIQNKKFNHVSHYKGEGATEVRPVNIIVPVEKDGAYTAEWWDTFTGEIVYTQQINSSHGELILPFSGTLKDMAVIVRSMGVQE